MFDFPFMLSKHLVLAAIPTNSLSLFNSRLHISQKDGMLVSF